MKLKNIFALLTYISLAGAVFAPTLGVRLVFAVMMCISAAGVQAFDEMLDR